MVEWFEDYNKSPKPLFFKRIFDKKIEDVITPVFYRVEKSCENTRPKIRIDYFTENGECVLILKNSRYQKKQRESRLEVMHPGNANAVINFIHKGLDSLDNTELKLPLNKLTQKSFTDIADKFVMEFRAS